MEIITLSVNKEDVMHDIAVTTSYTGAKMDNDEKALHRISTVDEDETHLERFWEESRADLCQELIGLVLDEGMKGASEDASRDQQDCRYEMRLEVSGAFDRALLPSMMLSLRSFFVHSIVAKWYVYTNKAEAVEYADKAVTLLDDIHRKALYKKRPTRPTYN